MKASGHQKPSNPCVFNMKPLLGGLCRLITGVHLDCAFCHTCFHAELSVVIHTEAPEGQKEG